MQPSHNMQQFVNDWGKLPPNHLWPIFARLLQTIHNQIFCFWNRPVTHNRNMNSRHYISLHGIDFWTIPLGHIENIYFRHMLTSRTCQRAGLNYRHWATRIIRFTLTGDFVDGIIYSLSMIYCPVNTFFEG